MRGNGLRSERRYAGNNPKYQDDYSSVTIKPLRVAVIVITYNSADVMGGCLASLPDGARDLDLVEVVVADNASRDDSMRIAKDATYLPIRMVQLGVNPTLAALSVVNKVRLFRTRRGRLAWAAYYASMAHWPSRHGACLPCPTDGLDLLRNR